MSPRVFGLVFAAVLVALPAAAQKQIPSSDDVGIGGRAPRSGVTYEPRIPRKPRPDTGEPPQEPGTQPDGNEAGDKKAEDKTEEPTPTPARTGGPRIERSPSGVIVIRGSRKTETPVAESEAGAEGETSAAGDQPETGVRAVARMLKESGDLPYLSSSKPVPPKTGTTEKRIQQFNSAGEPTQQEIIRTTTRKLADGSVQTITTNVVANVNGHENITQRTTTTEKKSGFSTKTTQTVERSSANGGLRTAEKTESVRRQQGKSEAQVETVKFSDNGFRGGLVETGRERTVMRKTARGAESETTIYSRSAITGNVALTGRKVGRMTERKDGSASETVEVYGTLGNVQHDAPMQLQNVVRRNVALGRDGSVQEMTTIEGRGTLAGQTSKTQRVSRLAGPGQVETAVYEQGRDGQMRATAMAIEPLK